MCTSVQVRGGTKAMSSGYLVITGMVHEGYNSILYFDHDENHSFPYYRVTNLYSAQASGIIRSWIRMSPDENFGVIRLIISRLIIKVLNP